MANKKRRKGKKGGVKSQAVYLTTLLILGAMVFGFYKYMGFSSVDDVLSWVRDKSDKVSYCTRYASEHSGQIPDECKGILNKKLPAPTMPSLPEPTPLDLNVLKEGSTNVDTSGYTAALEGIRVEEPQKVDYKRSDFRHWVGKPCNTRKQALINQGIDVVYSKDSKCKITSGTWNLPYAGGQTADQRSLDADHVIPLSYAAKHGADKWDAATKEAFANDLSQILMTSAKENRAKGDKGPGEYMPPNKDFHCQYSKIWVQTAAKYDLSVSEADARALQAGLATCK